MVDSTTTFQPSHYLYILHGHYDGIRIKYCATLDQLIELFTPNEMRLMMIRYLNVQSLPV